MVIMQEHTTNAKPARKHDACTELETTANQLNELLKKLLGYEEKENDR